MQFELEMAVFRGTCGLGKRSLRVLRTPATKNRDLRNTSAKPGYVECSCRITPANTVFRDIHPKSTMDRK